MATPIHSTLSRRERQIIDILYRRGRATAGEVMAELSGDPSYSTVRAQLRVLEDKGHVRHEEEGLRYVYAPAPPGRHLLRRLRRESGQRAPRRRGGAAHRHRARADRHDDRQSAKGRIAMSDALEIIVKTSVVVAAALAACRGLRGSPAALRHWILAGAIAGAAAVPVLRATLPAWPLRFEQARIVYAPTLRPSALSRSPAEVSAEVPPPAAQTFDAPPRSNSVNVADVLIATWLAGAACGLLLLAAGFTRLKRLGGRAQAIDEGPWRTICDELTAREGLRRVRLLQSDRPALLVTWGARTPRILLPAGAAGWTPDRIRLVLAHELAHAARGDWAVQTVAEVLRAVYWFNPLFWLASRHLRRESELACDDAVIAAGVEPPEYASELVAIARELRAERHAWVPAAAIVGPSHFERRITAMLNAHLNRVPPSGFRRIAAAIAIALITGGVAVAQNAFGRVSGVITDQTGAVLPNSTIRLTHVASGTKHEVRTGPNGAYDLGGLQSGDYTLEAEQLGFSAYREAVTFSPGQLLSKNVTMQVGSLQETITVVDVDTLPWERRSVPTPAKFTQRCEPTTTVGGNLRVPIKLVDVRPKYPINLRTANAEGVVTLNATIGVDGKIAAVSVGSSPSVDMSEAAIAAVRQWEFTPTLLNCRAIEVPMSVLIAFRPKQ
jgi:TonB family protein